MKSLSLFASICIFCAAIALNFETGAQAAPHAGDVASAPQKPTTTATLPLVIELDRPYVNLSFEKRDRSRRNARFLVDTGGGAFILSNALADDLGLTLGTAMEEEGETFSPVRTPLKVFFGSTPLELMPRRIIACGGTTISKHIKDFDVDGMLPGHVLAQYHVVFDYPAKTLTLAPPKSVQPKGVAIPMPVGKPSGFPRTEVTIAGVKYAMLIDTGASFTMVSEVLLKKFGEMNPQWPRYVGAHGGAKTLGGMTLETMYVPHAAWGGFEIGELGITSQREGSFEKWMSSMMKAPIVGALSTAAMREFRVELDYANETLYLSKPK